MFLTARSPRSLFLAGTLVLGGLMLSHPAFASEEADTLTNIEVSPITLTQEAASPETAPVDIESTPADPWDAPIVTDSPYFTQRPYTVTKGTVQGENDFGYQRNTDLGGIAGMDVDTFTLPVALARIGLTNSTEFRLWYLNHDIQSVDFRGSETTHHALGDGAIGIRQFLGTLPGSRVRLATEVTTTLPIGSNLFSAREWQPTVRLMAERPWGNLVLNANAAGMWPVDANRDYFFQFRPSAALTYNFNRRFSLFTEYLSIIPSTGVTNHLMQHGVRLLLTPNQQLSLSVGYGINELAPDLFVGVGYSFRVNQAIQRLFGHSDS